MDKIKMMKTRPGAVLPARATQGSAGYDLSAAIDGPMTVEMGGTTRVPTGIAIQLEPGTVGLVFGRSGLGTKHGVTMSNGVGVIDSDYRGEMVVSLTCRHTQPYTVRPGDRIAQLVIVPVLTPPVEEVTELDETDRGAGGFGSTGK